MPTSLIVTQPAVHNSFQCIVPFSSAYALKKQVLFSNIFVCIEILRVLMQLSNRDSNVDEAEFNREWYSKFLPSPLAPALDAKDKSVVHRIVGDTLGKPYL
jgi:hypothetical protein